MRTTTTQNNVHGPLPARPRSIEIEGGREVPVLDGSALGWALEVQFAGTRLAPEASALVGGRVDEQQPFRPTERLVARPEQVRARGPVPALLCWVRRRS